MHRAFLYIFTSFMNLVAFRTNPTRAAQDEWKFQCGEGVLQYIETHRRLLDSHNVREVVSYSRSGLSDRKKGAVTTFYFALLTGRAFRLIGDVWPGIYRSEINWTFTNVKMKQYRERKDVAYVEVPCNDNYGKGTHLRHLYESGNVNKAWERYTSIVLDTCFDWAELLFNNPHHMLQLYAMGLRPESATGCALSLLFNIRSDVLEPYRNVIRRIMKPETFVVGIQIRVGDALAFTNLRMNQSDTDVVAQVSPFSQCALDIERQASIPEQSVVWYVASDSLDVKRYVLRHFSSRVVVILRQAFQTRGSLGLVNFDGWKFAAAEQWILSLADFFVLSHTSGFGALSAARSMKNRNVFVLGTNAINQSRCQVQQPKSWFTRQGFLTFF
uniref:Fucosyltransferase n=1 Tax=Dunaliella tertiolecta TaxID=3047 RepID=A0A7S3QY19_DUNTE|mmetsp:Transcript_24310/g.66475  ORF Transcript_24310/g.66475 Transcript_24310/m.66475 type:complete len:385 (-) Transcript_24310:832-1986(-)